MKGNEILSIQTDGNEGKRKKINGNELKRHQWTRWETTWNEVKGNDNKQKPTATLYFSFLTLY